MENEFDKIPVLSIPYGHLMMITDLHWGWNSSSDEWQVNIDEYFRNWFIPFLKEQLKLYPDLCLLVLGDVFHDRSSIDINVYNLVIDLFEELAEIVRVYIFNGNHDLAKKTNKGNTSLRSLKNIDNVILIKEPTLAKFMSGDSCVATGAIIPYLGDHNEENRYLLMFNGKVDYAFMHTEISNMRLDNNMLIVGAVDSDKFGGMIYAGHIHKRQENKNVTYLGDPYQLKRSEEGNEKGIYILDLATGERKFHANTYSSKFVTIKLADLVNMTDKERLSAMMNNYVDVTVPENEQANYKQSKVYQLLNKSGAKKAQLKVLHQKKSNKEESEEHVELSIEELIGDMLDKLEGVSDERKARLKEMSSGYYRVALDALSI